MKVCNGSNVHLREEGGCRFSKWFQWLLCPILCLSKYPAICPACPQPLESPLCGLSCLAGRGQQLWVKAQGIDIKGTAAIWGASPSATSPDIQCPVNWSWQINPVMVVKHFERPGLASRSDLLLQKGDPRAV